MPTEVEKLLAEEEKKPIAPASGDKTPEQIKDEEQKKKETHLNNIKKAIEEGNAELKRIREAKAKANGTVIEDDTPKIDFNDPGAKAWDKHVSEKLAPVETEMAKEKEEVRTFALQQFLKDRPSLAKDPEKVKRVMATYEKIKTASERTTEGVLLDLRRAYSAEYADEILQDNHNSKMMNVAGEIVFSDIAISRGDSSLRDEKKAPPHITTADAAILAKWGMSAEEWVKLKESQDKQEKK